MTYSSIILYAADFEQIPDDKLDEYEVLVVDQETGAALYIRSTLRLGDCTKSLDTANPYPWETVVNTLPYSMTTVFEEEVELHEGHVQRD